jgi:DMSO/TMAO reductase YedYZ molybdopterin-dependent catalytic subunit
MKKHERSLEELYRDDPERADALLYNRKTGTSRRRFLGGAGVAAMGAMVGGTIPFSQNMPAGFVPAAFAQATPPAPPEKKGPQLLDFPGKDKNLVVLGDRPLVAETPESLLDDDTTPTAKFFIRNNGNPPATVAAPDTWKLAIDGEVNKPLEISLGDLKKNYRPQTLRMVLECGGNGRGFFSPTARGNQWQNGGAGCAEWTGVSLGDVLKTAGVKPSGVYTANYGADAHLSGDPKQVTLSRGVRIAKAMEPQSLLVWAMNGKPLENVHGGPLRLIIPGWAGSVSHKWVTKITIRDKEHDGPGMLGTNYRVPINPMVPGAKEDPKNFRILESMPVRSIITSPANGTKLAAGTRELKLRGASWAGDLTVKQVEISVDFGQTWVRANLNPPKNKFDWQRWTANVKVPSDGYYEVWAKATDQNGKAQPHVAANWNPQGYGSNPFHRVAVLIG